MSKNEIYRLQAANDELIEQDAENNQATETLVTSLHKKINELRENQRSFNLDITAKNNEIATLNINVLTERKLNKRQETVIFTLKIQFASQVRKILDFIEQFHNLDVLIESEK